MQFQMMHGVCLESRVRRHYVSFFAEGCLGHLRAPKPCATGGAHRADAGETGKSFVLKGN